ncbi:uncharacterized protein GGS22DRAFT_169701 [Annulohypoxylon maeteangense]|uniref:uncharacterized protein n=1 Tax=Annulohypoxylon maeteangense TaxID=1927788 RepID=UPI0020076018|nr:uncharacterized protein GGS22DRAFT_169701 [Annulohypoxylon maeteangense]KAI0882540.1 hypothetical protein GGS22DRAFT_169701 [Annulohypoxylon maeteangense]
MTDRQITESTIGLAGRLSHLPYGLTKAEDRGWQSTRNFTQRTPVFKELGLHKIWRPTASASLQSPSSSASNWHTSRKQQKWLLKSNPEARLGNEYIHDELVSSNSSPQTRDSQPWSSSLFAIGELTDTSDPQVVTGAPLVAIATGEANDVLRLAKPGIEEWQWHGEGSVSLGFGDLTEQDESILVKDEFAGSIRRLKSVVDSKRYDPTRWIIVQRDTGTQVFQPEYRLAATVSAYDRGGKISRIAANPLFFLSKDQTGGSLHLDASFNPGVRSKPPQLGLIDECGFWSIWDIAHTRIRSSRKPKVRISKCGHIEQGILGCPPLKGTGEPQWHKMFWVGCPSGESQELSLEEDADNPETPGSFPQLVRSSTLLLCNTKLVRLFDLANNSALPDLSFIAERSRDCILDVHPNPRDSQYFFVLTSSKLFVVRACSAPGQDWGQDQKQWSIVLAVSHLRDGFDASLKLTVAPGATLPGQATSLIYISSNSNARIDLFCVTMMKSDPSRVAYHSETVVLDAFQRTPPETAPLAICVHPIPVALKPSKVPTQFARSFATQQIQFYQLAVLTRDMCLVSSLCVSTFSLSIDQINRPDYKVTRTQDQSRQRKRALKQISARFVVQNGVIGDDNEGEYHSTITPCVSRWTVTRRHVGVFYEFLRVFLNEARGYQEPPVGDEEFGYNPFDDVHIATQRAIEDGNMPATTIFQMIENLKLPNDMSLAASDWRLEIERLGRINSEVVLLALDQPHIQTIKPSSSLDDLHSALVIAMAGANFDDETHGWISEARSTVIRQIACDIYLSLFGLVHRPVGHQMDLNESQQTLAHDLDNMAIDSQQGSRAVSVARSQSEVSTTSSTESKPEISPEEDPAMTLLRSYTGTGRFVPTKSTALLDKWQVGASLDDYVFDLNLDQEENPGMQRRAKKLARESRKRRRAETLLQIHKDQGPSLPATQPAPNTRFSSQFSQPTGGFSSQPIRSGPSHTMSQPMTGIFGRREERPKKKAKKRVAGF